MALLRGLYTLDIYNPIPCPANLARRRAVPVDSFICNPLAASWGTVWDQSEFYYASGRP